MAGSFRYVSGAYVVSDTPGVGKNTIAMISGFNPTGGDLFFQIHATSPDPGEVPLLCILVPGGAQFSWVPASADGYRPSVNSFYFGVSTTGPTYTAAGSGFWVEIDGNES